MHLDQLLLYFNTSPALHLLRSRNAPFIVDFLSRQFKQSGRIAVGHAELLADLIAYREHIQELHAEALLDKAETYLSQWCARETRWLHRFLEAGRNEPIYQLTPHSEDVISFLDRVLEKDLGFVGTESRLRLVIETLANLVIGASADPELRLHHLRDEKSRVEREIEQIERAGEVSRFQPTQIRERFATAVSLLRQLQGDFRAVEEKFKEIAQQVQQRHNEGVHTRGCILEFALDCEDVLKKEDQGASFYEFVDFILSPTQQEKLQVIVQQLNRLEELADQADGLDTVRRMVPLLLAEAEKVMRTNQRLSATLRRLLDVRTDQQRQLVTALLREIRGLACSLAAEPPVETIGLELEDYLDIASPLARTFWCEPPQFAPVDLTEFVADTDRRAAAFGMLARLRPLDWRGMRRHVTQIVAAHGPATLAQLLEEYPPHNGVVEVLGYLQIALDDGHLISKEAEEIVVLPGTGQRSQTLALTVPLVQFIATREAQHADQPIAGV